MGDVHYRIGRYRKSSKRLRVAIELKEQYLFLRPPARETYSLLAAMYLAVYKIDGDLQYLTKAVNASIGAHKVDLSWPWPLLQVANILESHNSEFEAVGLPGSLKTDDPTTSLDPVELKRQAVDLAVQSEEFRRHVLGGRTGVFVLSDHHRLLSRSLVLKPTTFEQAHSEMNIAVRFSIHLEELGLKDEYLLPTPICVRPIAPSGCVYAMARVDGEVLGENLYEMKRANRHSEIAARTRQTVRYLAIYHAWKMSTASELPPSTSWRSVIQDAVRLTGDEKKEVTLLSAAIDGSFRIPPLLLPKKDAHPENWMVSASGQIIMIDLEATGFRPAVFEVAQLLDDYDVLAVSEDGFQERLSVAMFYADEMERLGCGIGLDVADAERIYALCWILRAGFGLRYCMKKREISSNAQHRISARAVHHKKALQFLSERYSSSPLGRIASTYLQTC